MRFATRVEHYMVDRGRSTPAPRRVRFCDPTHERQYQLSDLKQRQADRLRVMAAIFDESGASQSSFVQLWPIREAFGFSDEYMGAIIGYLAAEGLVEPLKASTGSYTPMHATITHWGIKEMELSQEHPETPTEHFPPSINVTVHGNITGSPLQIGTTGSTQKNQVGSITVDVDTKKAIGDFVAEFEAKAKELVAHGEQTQADVDRIAADVATMKAQASAPEPRKHFLAECKNSIKSILEHGVGGVATLGLLALITRIPL